MATLRLRARAGAATATEVALDEWLAGARPPGPAAVVVPNTADLSAVGGALGEAAAVILSFPNFKDGRAYSQARVLRERFDYGGEVRARGEVLRDQALFMARVGIDAFETADPDFSGLEAALAEFSKFYQSGADGSEPAWRLRRALSRAA